MGERRARGWQVSLPIYIANMLKSLKARSKQADSDLELMDRPNAFPLISKAPAFDRTKMKSLRVETLRYTIAWGRAKLGKWQWNYHKGRRGHAALSCAAHFNTQFKGARRLRSSDLTCYSSPHAYPEIHVCVAVQCWRWKTRSTLSGPAGHSSCCILRLKFLVVAQQMSMVKLDPRQPS